jgi:hypothetical protein
MLVGKDTNDKIETPFLVPAKRCNPLPQGTRLKACGGCCYSSPLSPGRVGLKPADWPVTGQAQALQRRKYDDYLLSFNVSWTDDDSDAKGDANEIACSNKDGDEGHAILTPVYSTNLFKDNRILVSCQMERDKASILDGDWPGPHNITLLTRHVVCHFTGYWNSYLPFAHLADSQSLDNPSSFIQLDDWRSLIFNGGDLSALPSSVVAECALGYRPAVGPKELDGNSLGNNLCNKTDVDSIESPPLIGPGTVVTAASHCPSPRKVSLAKSLSGHPNICTMFLTMCACTPAKVAAAQVMETNIALQVTEEATQVEHLQALRVKFPTAAQIEFGSKEKRLNETRQLDSYSSASTAPPSGKVGPTVGALTKFRSG